MTRFYEINMGSMEKPFRTLKALCEANDLEGEYDNILYKINQGKPWTNGEVIVKRKIFEECKKNK